MTTLAELNGQTRSIQLKERNGRRMDGRASRTLEGEPEEVTGEGRDDVTIEKMLQT